MRSFWQSAATMLWLSVLCSCLVAAPISDKEHEWMVSVDNLVLEHIDEMEEGFTANEALEKYEAEYRQVLRGRTGVPVGKAEMQKSLAKANCVFLTDEHTVAKAQANTVWVLETMSKGQGPVALVLEWIDASFQKDLDQYLRGEITAEELKKTVRYDELWGFPWGGYKAVLEKAKSLQIPVLLADSFIEHKSLAQRDDQVVARMNLFKKDNPQTRFLVVYGAFHILGKDHMGEKAAKAGLKPDLFLVGEASEIFWQALTKHKDTEKFPFLSLGDNIFYIQNGTPVERHRSYRQYLMDLLGYYDDDFDYPLSEMVDDEQTRFSRLWSKVN